MQNLTRWTAAITGAATLALGAAAFAQAPMRVVGNFSGNKIHVEEVERPFFQDLEKTMGMQMVYNPMDAIGVNAADALRMIKSGSFDIMSVQIGMAARDDPFFEGIDLAGVAADLKSQRAAAKAFKPKMDERLQKRFNAKLLTLWPFGPQMMFCNGDISSVDDLKGKKVRVFTASMSRLVEALGATPVTLQFSEVYLALQRGVADCGVTAPSAGNSGKWPEVTKVFVPLSLSYSVQGHLMNLDRWNSLTPDQQKTLQVKFDEMEARMWDIAADYNDDAIRCNTGQQDCKHHGRYDMKLVDVGGKNRDRIVELTNKVVLPPWAESCTRGYKECVPVWNETVGKATGFSIAPPAK
ncbi:TRAP transporter substrate-binding protein [Paracandidimonas lactea]|uniref:TRAP transporter substrate-binding protein n=1 Tax=Paracandidimonas lactea TaxID=2895524 RepID=UPI001F1A7F12|nr:TRAP transporter substrate-binding protein [Paracandidimonas lactea]